MRQKEFDGFDGILLRSKTSQKGIIGVNAGIREASRKHFTVAHEIGQFVIPHHRELASACEGGCIESSSRRLAPPELEANELSPVRRPRPYDIAKGDSHCKHYGESPARAIRTSSWAITASGSAGFRSLTRSR